VARSVAENRHKLRLAGLNPIGLASFEFVFQGPPSERRLQTRFHPPQAASSSSAAHQGLLTRYQSQAFLLTICCDSMLSFFSINDHYHLSLDLPEHTPIALKNRRSDKRLKVRFLDPHSGEVRPLVPRQLRPESFSKAGRT
jgi:hypothetical protein